MADAGDSKSALTVGKHKSSCIIACASTIDSSTVEINDSSVSGFDSLEMEASHMLAVT